MVWGKPRDDGPTWPRGDEDSTQALQTLREGRGPRGALEVAGRVERLWLGRGAPDVQTGGATSGALAVRWWDHVLPRGGRGGLRPALRHDAAGGPGPA
ncbi:hypothetical protein MFU01_29960 [Myxococcus fulvus]|uniref:Uncharacterized protein n=1 Tax=Myxococcus fulvus TaxID=33 RepID=A0A511T1D5_MYXFU|nr:hypothetical protein MFU01_29960 [Myxococcus fulvus]